MVFIFYKTCEKKNEKQKIYNIMEIINLNAVWVIFVLVERIEILYNYRILEIKS